MKYAPLTGMHLTELPADGDGAQVYGRCQQVRQQGPLDTHRVPDRYLVAARLDVPSLRVTDRGARRENDCLHRRGGRGGRIGTGFCNSQLGSGSDMVRRA